LFWEYLRILRGGNLRKLSFTVDFFIELDQPDVFYARINWHKTVKNDQNREKKWQNGLNATINWALMLKYCEIFKIYSKI
jgi:hypothetical protein